MLELYYEGLFKESAVQGDIREGVKGIVAAEVGIVRDARWNRVSYDKKRYSIQKKITPGVWYKPSLFAPHDQ